MYKIEIYHVLIIIIIKNMTHKLIKIKNDYISIPSYLEDIDSSYEIIISYNKIFYFNLDDLLITLYLFYDNSKCKNVFIFSPTYSKEIYDIYIKNNIYKYLNITFKENLNENDINFFIKKRNFIKFVYYLENEIKLVKFCKICNKQKCYCDNNEFFIIYETKFDFLMSSIFLDRNLQKVIENFL